MLVSGSWAAGGRWELAAATGRGEAQAGATGSVGTAGGLVVHGGAGGAATVRDPARGPAWPELLRRRSALELLASAPFFTASAPFFTSNNNNTTFFREKVERGGA